MYKILRNNLLFMFVLLATVSNAQNTLNYIQEDRLLQKGAELYEKEMYERAQDCFSDIIEYYSDEHTDVKANAEYYSALCAIALYNRDAEDRIAEFIAMYPESPLTRLAYFEMGKYQYRKKNYQGAIDYFELVWKQHLTKEQLAEYYFKLGYSYYKLGNNAKATKVFYELVNRESKYYGPAVYYYAYLAYEKGKYQTALNRFGQIKDDPTFAPIVPYYEVQIYYLQGKYDKVLALGPNLVDSTKSKRSVEISRLMGEALYNNEQYTEALEYLEKYKENASTYTREDIYQLGYVYYKTGDFDNAAQNFSDITNADDKLTQNAYFHIAVCYLKQDKKEQALLAFKSAAEYDFDPEIKEQSALSYAKLSYELSYSPFNETIIAFHNFIDNYPNSIYKDEVYSYLVKVYLTSKNYSLALESLRKIKIKTPEMLSAYQRVAYFRGLELFNNLEFAEAFKAFDESVRQRAFDNKIKALATYWRAEALYRMKNYSAASESYNSFLLLPGAFSLGEYNTAYYNLGYAHFKMKDYGVASTWFRKFIDKANEVDSVKLADAIIRTADCFFILRDYSEALVYYDRAVIFDTFDVDYAHFQKGFTYGLLKDYKNKSVTLSSLLDKENPDYAVDALYERGRSYVMMDSTRMAINDFSDLVNKYPNSSYALKSHLQLGLLYYGNNQHEEALVAYKNVVEKYPGTAEANDALMGIKNIYVDMNNVDSYFEYAEGKSSAGDITVSEKDSLTYMAAEKIYMSAQWKLAQKLFDDYLEKYPNGKFILNAHYYRGDCMFRNNDKENALKDFKYVVEQPKNIFTEQSLVNAADLEYEQGDYSSSYELFAKLEIQAEIKSNMLTARLGKVRSAYRDSAYDNAIESAKRLLVTDKVSEEETREGRMVLAKSYYATKMNDLALTQFRILALDVANVEGAESKYRVAEILYSQNKLENAEAEINNFIEIGTYHQYWLAKSFMLLSDIYVVKDKGFKAKAYLQSITSNYTNTDDGIIEEAKAKLDKIIKSESENFVEIDEADLAPESQNETDTIPNQE